MNRPTLIPPAALVIAALIFAAGLIGAALIIRDGLKLAAGSLAGSIDKHAQVMSGLQRPVIKIESPLDIHQPVRIEGPREDGSLPVNATIGK